MMSENQLEQELKPGVGYTDEAKNGTDPRYIQERGNTVNVEDGNQTRQPVIGEQTEELTPGVDPEATPAEEPGAEPKLTDGSADEVLARVGDDPEKAKAALDEEKKGQKRKGLTNDLQAIVDKADEK